MKIPDGEYDLAAIANALRGTLAHKALVNTIDQVRDAYSAVVDLSTALSAATQLVQLVEDEAQVPLEWNAQTTALALLTQALVSYSRVTRTKSDHRATFKDLIRKRLTPEQREVDDFLVGLRNDGVAHFGFGGPGYCGPAIVSEVPILQWGIEKRIVFVGERLFSSTELAYKVRQQIIAVGESLDALGQEKMADAISAITTAIEIDPDIAAIIAASEFDPNAHGLATAKAHARGNKEGGSFFLSVTTEVSQDS